MCKKINLIKRQEKEEKSERSVVKVRKESSTKTSHSAERHREEKMDAGP